MAVGVEKFIAILNMEEYEKGESLLLLFLAMICFDSLVIHVRSQMVLKPVLGDLGRDVTNEDLHHRGCC